MNAIAAIRHAALVQQFSALATAETNGRKLVATYDKPNWTLAALNKELRAAHAHLATWRKHHPASGPAVTMVRMLIAFLNARRDTLLQLAEHDLRKQRLAVIDGCSICEVCGRRNCSTSSHQLI